LLYKAKHLRFKDQRDFEASAPTLDAAARAWLATALAQAHPGHPWSPALRVAHAFTMQARDDIRGKVI
jgi:hypothetical protein